MSAAAAVRAGDDLEEMPAGILPIHPAASVIGVELARPAFEGVGPVRQAAFSDPTEDLVEFRLADQKGIVLRIGGTVVVGEVEPDVICRLNNHKRTKGRWVGQPEDLRQEGRRLLLVPESDNRVVQLHRHRIDVTSCRRDSPGVVPSLSFPREAYRLKSAPACSVVRSPVGMPRNDAQLAAAVAASAGRVTASALGS